MENPNCFKSFVFQKKSYYDIQTNDFSTSIDYERSSYESFWNHNQLNIYRDALQQI